MTSDRQGRTSPHFARVATVLTVASMIGCGGQQSAPEAGDYLGAVPDLMGRTVMVLPAQIVDWVPEPVAPEIVFALEEHGEGIDWVMPNQIRRAATR